MQENMKETDDDFAAGTIVNNPGKQLFSSPSIRLKRRSGSFPGN